jgi:hypothetical protein
LNAEELKQSLCFYDLSETGSKAVLLKKDQVSLEGGPDLHMHLGDLALPASISLATSLSQQALRTLVALQALQTLITLHAWRASLEIIFTCPEEL